MIYGFAIIFILLSLLTLVSAINNNDTTAKSQSPEKCANCSALCPDYSVRCSYK